MGTNSDFTYPDTTEKPPFFERKQTPEDIVGPRADLLKRHYKIYDRYETEERRNAAFASANITYADREMIAELYKALRDNGYRILGLDELDRIKLGVITANFPQKRHYTKEECDAAREEFKRIAAGGFGRLIRDVPKSTRDEINYEKFKTGEKPTEF